jgi:hypothetical protein
MELLSSLEQDQSIEESSQSNNNNMLSGIDGNSYSLNSHRGFNRVMILDRNILHDVNNEMEFEQDPLSQRSQVHIQDQ